MRTTTTTTTKRRGVARLLVVASGLAFGAVGTAHFCLVRSLVAVPHHGAPTIATSTASPHRAKASAAGVPRYFEIEADLPVPENPTARTRSSYKQAGTIVDTRTKWFEPKRICREEFGCCAETVAIPMGHEDHRIVSVMDGVDLADLRIQNFAGDVRVKHHARHLDERMLPCLQPGTILFLENHARVQEYFWTKLRPRIAVPFLILTSRSDGDSPLTPALESRLDDPLLLRWYGTNPHRHHHHHHPVNTTTTTSDKFRPMMLGLSYQFPQELYLRPYLEATGYRNPFRDPARFDQRPIDLSTDVLVQFGLRQKHRVRLWNSLCGGKKGAPRRASSSNHTTPVSCRSTRELSPGELYSAASRYSYGVSPPGKGWDCYRTYEWLLLGIVPVIQAREGDDDDELFGGLPVVRMRSLGTATKEDLREAIEEFKGSSRRGDDDGWERLFLGYWRRRILRDAHRRDLEILKDEDGLEHYQAWRYSPHDEEHPVLCSKEGNCV